MKLFMKFARRIPGYAWIKELVGFDSFRLRTCYGVFPTFQDAQKAIPTSKLVGYDHEQCVELYADMGVKMHKPSDYPIYFWLAPLLAAGKIQSIFDFGGNQGVSFYSFQEYLTFPPQLRWLVCDVSSFVIAGRQIAQERKAANLFFTTEFTDAEGLDALFTSGTLQYVEREFADLLGLLRQRPRHVFVNRVPLTEHETYYTLQDLGPSYAVYRIANRAAFIASIEKLGYEVVDSWSAPESLCRVRYHRSLKVDAYSGFYFRQI